MKRWVLFALLLAVMVMTAGCSKKPKVEPIIDQTPDETVAVEDSVGVSSLNAPENNDEQSSDAAEWLKQWLEEQNSKDDYPIPLKEIYGFVNVYGDNVSEINLTQLLGWTDDDEIFYATPLDDRFIFILWYHHTKLNEPTEIKYDFDFNFSVIDSQTEKVVYIKQVVGILKSLSLETNTETKVRYLISSVEKSGKDEYYATYIYPDKSEVKKLGTDLPSRMLYGKEGEANRTLIEKDWGIFEVKNGKLIELLPSIPEKYINLILNEEWDKMTGEDYNEYLSLDSYRFVAQIESDRFLYEIDNFEAVPGFGIYNFETGKYTYVPDSNNSRVIGVSGNLIYSMHTDWLGLEGFRSSGILYVTKADTLKTKLLLDPLEFAERKTSGKRGEPYFHAELSPDGKSIALISYYLNFDYDGEYTVYLFNTSDGGLQAKYDLFSPSTDYANVKFMGNNKLLISGGGYSQKDNYIFIIDTKAN